MTTPSDNSISDNAIMDEHELSAEVLRLALVMQQGQASDEELARLERLLSDRALARRLYVGVVDDTATLAETADTTEPLPDDSQEAGESPHLDSVPEAPNFSRGVFRRLLQWIGTPPSLAELALAAGLLIAVTWGAVHWPTPLDISSALPLARIVSLSDVQWEAGADQFREWSVVRAGDDLRFTSGMLELAIDNSVQLVLEGPADFELVSSKKAIARQGKLVARVGPEGIGFEIETPHAQVTDLGTSFGITITPDEQTDVVVYEGQVDLEYRASRQQRGARRLESGEGLRVGAAGAVNRIVQVEDGSFVPPPRLGSVTVKRPQIIDSVSDNISLQQTAKYYRIVGGGIQEDCQAYVDRLHQWNGVDEHGIPAVLQLADYVMGFNDDKVLPNLQVTVELNQPARLFVLWDDRVDVPDWLRAGFKDTMWRIGLDEAFVPGDGRGKQRAGTGAGNSIDLEFSVWQRDVPRAARIMLGPVRSEATPLAPLEVPASMYGIAAVPLEAKWAADHALEQSLRR